VPLAGVTVDCRVVRGWVMVVPRVLVTVALWLTGASCRTPLASALATTSVTPGFTATTYGTVPTTCLAVGTTKSTSERRTVLAPVGVPSAAGAVKVIVTPVRSQAGPWGESRLLADTV